MYYAPLSIHTYVLASYSLEVFVSVYLFVSCFPSIPLCVLVVKVKLYCTAVVCTVHTHTKLCFLVVCTVHMSTEPHFLVVCSGSVLTADTVTFSS